VVQITADLSPDLLHQSLMQQLIRRPPDILLRLSLLEIPPAGLSRFQHQPQAQIVPLVRVSPLKTSRVYPQPLWHHLQVQMLFLSQFLRVQQYPSLTSRSSASSTQASAFLSVELHLRMTLEKARLKLTSYSKELSLVFTGLGEYYIYCLILFKSMSACQGGLQEPNPMLYWSGIL